MQQRAAGVRAIQRDGLTDEQRRTTYDQIANRMALVHSDFDNGAQTAEEDVRNEQAADANIAKAFFGIAMAVMIPGFGPIAGSVLGRFGVTVTTEVANVIGGAVGEAAKSAGNEQIDKSYARNPRAFFTSITRAFEAGLKKEHDWISSKKLDRAALPDAVMTRLASYYDKLSDAEGADWARMFKSLWDRFNEQVVPVGRTGSAMTGYGPTPHLKNMVARVHWGGRHRFALVQRVRTDFTSGLERLLGRSDIRTYYRFLRWIDDDLADAAMMRAGHVLVRPEGGIRQLPEEP